MKKKELFDDIGDSILADDSLDVNVILSGAPGVAPKTDEVVDEEDTTKDTKKAKKTDDVKLDVNRALADTISSLDEEDTEDTEETITSETKEETEAVDTEKKAPGLQIEKTPSSDVPFTVIFARDLNDRGLLSSYDEEKLLKDITDKGEAEAFRTLFRSEVDANVQAAKTDLDAGYQEYLSLIGEGVNGNEAAGILELKEYFAGIDAKKLEENEDLRKDVMTKYYKATTQLSDDKIDKLVARSVDLGDDVEESKEHLQTISKLIDDEIKTMKDSAAEQQKLMQQEQQRQLTLLKEGIDNIVEILPGQRINKQTKDKMYATIVKPVQDKFGNTTNAIWAKRSEDPLEFDTKLAYLIETGFFEKGKSWEKLKAVITTQSTGQLDKWLDGKKVQPGVIGGGTVPDRKLREMISDTGSIL